MINRVIKSVLRISKTFLFCLFIAAYFMAALMARSQPSGSKSLQVDIGVFSTECANFEVRLRPGVDFPDNYLTNVQFTIKWPANTVDLITFSSTYGVSMQGEVITVNDNNYAVFVSATSFPVNWSAGNEYIILSFSHDEAGSGYASFLVDELEWAQTNNGTYYVEMLGQDFTGDVYHNAEDIYIGPCGKVDIRFMLQGPYDTQSGLMNTTLNSLNVIPTNQPYNTTPWSYSGSEQVITLPDSILDWVLIELRDKNDNTLVLETRAGLLSKSGIVMDTDFTRGVYFSAAESFDDFYIAVWHRNHLPVMAADVKKCPNLGDVYDFTTGQDKAYGTDAMKELDTGVFGLFAGDANGNGTIQNPDFAVWRSNAGFTGVYQAADFNMNGTVQNPDFAIWRSNAGLNKQFP